MATRLPSTISSLLKGEFSDSARKGRVLFLQPAVAAGSAAGGTVNRPAEGGLPVLVPADFQRGLADIAEDHVARGVGEPGDRSEEDRHLQLLGEFKGGGGHILGLLLVLRLQAGHLGVLGHHPGVLLGRGVVGAGVVGDHDHQPAPGPGVGQGGEGVHRHVQPGVLHHHQGPGPGQGRPGGDVDRHLLVQGPLEVEAQLRGQLAQDLSDLARGGAGVADPDLDPGLDRSAGDRLVPHQQGLVTGFVFSDSVHSYPP